MTTTVIEVCCGSASFSDAVRRAGFAAFPIDHQANRHRTKVRPIILDLTNDNHISIFKQLCIHSRPCLIFCGFPCGTCSRTRDKRLPADLGQGHGPPPLRSDQHVWGLPNLSPTNQHEVNQANKIYQLILWIMEFCIQTGCLLAVENPHRSYLWQLIASLLQTRGQPELQSFAATLEHVIFDMCMHGGSRDKRTKLLSSPNLFSPLALDCDNSHTHESWTPYQSHGELVYPTAAEAEYLAELSKRMAACLVEAVQAMGLEPRVPPRLYY